MFIVETLDCIHYVNTAQKAMTYAAYLPDVPRVYAMYVCKTLSRDSGRGETDRDTMHTQHTFIIKVLTLNVQQKKT